MKAISLWQPWASAIAAGLKTVETRSWPTPYRGPLAIHAAKRWTGAEQDFLFAQLDGPSKEYFRRVGITRGHDIPLGAIVATCEIYDCLSTSSETDAEKLRDHHQAFDEMSWGNYSEGRFAWLLRNVKPITPVPCVGKQGFFDWTPTPPKAPTL